MCIEGDAGAEWSGWTCVAGVAHLDGGVGQCASPDVGALLAVSHTHACGGENCYTGTCCCSCFCVYICIYVCVCEFSVVSPSAAAAVACLREIVLVLIYCCVFSCMSCQCCPLMLVVAVSGLRLQTVCSCLILFPQFSHLVAASMMWVLKWLHLMSMRLFCVVAVVSFLLSISLSLAVVVVASCILVVGSSFFLWKFCHVVVSFVSRSYYDCFMLLPLCHVVVAMLHVVAIVS